MKRKGLVSGYSAEDIIAMMKRVKTQSANGERNHPAGTKAGHDQLKAVYPYEAYQIPESRRNKIA